MRGENCGAKCGMSIEIDFYSTPAPASPLTVCLDCPKDERKKTLGNVITHIGARTGVLDVSLLRNGVPVQLRKMAAIFMDIQINPDWRL